jgi:hypothetical protein
MRSVESPRIRRPLAGPLGRRWRIACDVTPARNQEVLMSDEQDRAARAPRDPNEREQRAESGKPGGGAGRRDEVGGSGVYPMSGGMPEGKHPEIRTPAAWGQGDRGAEGYNDSGGSELVMRDGQLLGGLTAGPDGAPTIDIHGGDRPRSDGETDDARKDTRKR